MAADSVCHLRHELYLDLRPDIGEIKRTFRKSYKSLIRVRFQNVTVGVA